MDMKYAFCSAFTKLDLPNHLYPDCAHWEVQSVEHMVCYHHLQHPTCTGTDTCTALLRHSALISFLQFKKLSLPPAPLCSHLTHFKLQLIRCIWTEQTLNCQTPNSKPLFTLTFKLTFTLNLILLIAEWYYFGLQ